MNRTVLTSVVLGLGLVSGCVRERVIEVERPHRVERFEYIEGRPAPARIVEVRPVRPHPHAVWVEGYWEHRGHEWVWVHGCWK